MSTLPDTAFWLRALGVLALQGLFIVAGVALLAPRLRSGRVQRAAWLAGFGALGLLLAGTVVGLDGQVAAWLESQPKTERAFRVQTNLPASPDTAAHETTLSSARATDLAEPSARAIRSGSRPLLWPAWLWLAGAGIVAGRKLVLRVTFGWWWRRGGRPAPASIENEVRQVARRLGMSGQVRVVEIPTLVGPVAFGVLRPTIGLAPGFGTRHGQREREAMLAHELAHLSARDPVWLALADGVCAALWWLPPLWWAQRRLRVACEAAADEASVVVEDGPAVLADCLVSLAARLPRAGAFGVLGMALFRSDLGRRVERLLELRRCGLAPSSGRRVLVGASLAALSAATLGLVSSAWALPKDSAGRPTLLALAQGALTAAGEDRQNPATTPTDGQSMSGTLPSIPLLTRTFRLDPNTASQSLEALVGKESRGLAPPEALRRIFDSMGVHFGDRPAAGLGETAAGADAGRASAGGAMLYNDRTGVLLVRATAQDLSTIETVLQMLNSTPPQVTLEVKFVEITQEASKALGFDGFLGNLLGGGAALVDLPATGIASPAGVFPGAGVPAVAANLPTTGQVATIAGMLTDPQFHSVTRALEAAGVNASPTQELRGDQLDWPGRSATNAANIRIETALGARLTGILTDRQYPVALKALEQQAGVEMLVAPRVTTLSGRQAQVQITDMRTVMTAVNPAALVQSGVPAGRNAIPYLTSAIPVGPMLDVIPNVGADGYTITLTVIPTLTEFLGYDDPGEGGRVRVWADGSEKTVALPLPRFRVRQMVTQAQLWDGQTLVLGGLPIEVAPTAKDTVPVLGDLPLSGRMIHSESTQKVRKQLLVFVTATIVDPAGNRVHTGDSRPYDPNTVPRAQGSRVGSPAP
ncbi:MAG: hypothetical protein FJ387_21235 [Verrucomicrobia bacterium]|nr:hypothetical protein [Verrucomicrobiota bacterium]